MLYIVTAVHNRKEITKRFANRLASQNYKKYTLIIIDDGCTDGTVEAVRAIISDPVILKGNGNLFWGGALDMAYRWLSEHASDADYVMFANDDTQFADDYLENAMTVLGQYDENVLLTGCGYSLETGKQIDGVVHWNYRTGEQNHKYIPNDAGNCSSTRSLFFSVKVLKKTGGFHPVLLPHYGSDYEWTLRASRAGFRIISSEDVAYMFSEKTTGDNDFDTLTSRKLFSKRSIKNPFYRMSFIILSTPIRYFPMHFCYQMKRYAKKIPVFFEILTRRT